MTAVSIMGGSGYVGGELLRLLLSHEACDLQIVTSRRYAGVPLFRAHPNLRGVTTLTFEKEDVETIAAKSEVVFTALPHGKSIDVVPQLLDRGLKVIDLAADFRLKNPAAYKEYYEFAHSRPDLLEKSVYGLPELHRAAIKSSQLVSIPGCMATAAILSLAPIVAGNLVDLDRIVIDAKIGSSGAGVNPTEASHHAERSGGVRPYKVVGHRHIAEVEQELGGLVEHDLHVAFTPHAVNMIRGILSTTHTFTHDAIEPRDVFKTYRAKYAAEPFIRLVSDQKGLYGLPNPKVTIGTNYCDIGFDIDAHAHRLVLFAALDNLTKGAAGEAVQCFNLMTQLDEKTGLTAVGMHP
ncbi:MAG TPA: N-acetyl-gamma-glutamyl-phosphate reductase [Terriglobales bacterium]|nr:N-acetyl-gamma-glutamyl-phosphate reductase [Terriglobales bacterium]